MTPDVAVSPEWNEAWRLFSAYRDLLQSAYQAYNLSLPIASRTHFFSLDRSMNGLLSAFENDFSARLPSFSFDEIEMFKWLLVDKPNNLFIESFHETDGGLNSIMFDRILSGVPVRSFLRMALQPAIDEQRTPSIHMPFCGKSFELPGLVCFLESEFSSHDITLTLTDINVDDVQASERLLSTTRSARRDGDQVKTAVRVQFRPVDLATDEQPHCELVIGIHPQLFNRYERFISDKWRSILRNVLANADSAILFLLSPTEVKAAVEFLRDEYWIEDVQNDSYIVLPRSYIKGTHVRGLGLSHGHNCYRYYGYPIMVRPRSKSRSQGFELSHHP